MKKLLFIFGTRPEAIKLAPVILEVKKRSSLKAIVAVTAQHRHMLDQVLTIFGILPDYDLNIMSPSQSLNDISSRVISGIDGLLQAEKPDWVIVHGDTTTTMAASLAAFHRQIPIAHVEAGLRTFDLQSPFPEEMNRQVTGRLASCHFVPTQRAQRNLIKEGKSGNTIFLVGNTVVDSILWVLSRFSREPQLLAELDKRLPLIDKKKTNILVTMHRRENFSEGLDAICKAILEVIKANGNVQFIIPLHLNPTVQTIVKKNLEGVPEVSIISPLEYLTFVRLMQMCDLILTDSGGLQEEAPTLGKRVLVLRNETERPEAVEAGCAKLVGTDKAKIFAEVMKFMDQPDQNSELKNPFGDGQTSKKICEFFEKN